MEEEVKKPTEIAVVVANTISEIVVLAPQTLEMNKQSLAKATDYGDKLMFAVEEQGMSPEMDAQINKYLGRLKETLELLKSRRMPLTKMFDDVKSVFTGLEATLDPKNADTIYAKFTKIRNDYAAAVALENKKKKEKIERDQNVAEEKITFKAAVQKSISDAFLAAKFAANNYLRDLFNNVTLDTYDSVVNMVSNVSEEYPFSNFRASGNPAIRAIYLTDPDIVAIKTECQPQSEYDRLNAEFRAEIGKNKRATIDKLPGKKETLQEIANEKDKKAKQKLLDDEAEKKRQDDEALRKTQTQQTAEANDKISQEAEVGKTQNMFNTEATIATELATPAAKAVTKIKVINPAGYMNIVSMYFKSEGLSKTPLELEKVTLLQMKTYCEKKFAKDGIKMESIYINYEEEFSVKVKKS